MSLVKATPEGLNLKDRRAKESPYANVILYAAKNDSIQEMVSALKAESLKIQFGKGTEL
jgi:hypothetical protein